MPLIDTGLLARYYVDEAASGNLPAALLDASDVSPAEDIPIDYGTGPNLSYTEIAGNRGINSASETGDGVCTTGALASGNKIFDAVTVSTGVTLEYVFNASVYGNGVVFGFILPGVQNTFFYRHGSSPEVMFNGASVLFGSVASPTSQRLVVHLVLDTTQATEADRIKVYVNGVDQAANFILIGSIPLNSTLSSSNLALTAQEFGAIAGTWFYGAVYNLAFNQANVTNNLNILTVDDDTPAVVGGNLQAAVAMGLSGSGSVRGTGPLGASLPLALSVSPLLGQGGGPTGTVSFTRVDNGNDAVNRTTYTDALIVSSGGGERTFVLVVGGRATATNRAVASATLGGAVGTIEVQHTINDGPNSTISAIVRFSAADMIDPSATNLDLSLTFSGLMIRAHWDLYETPDLINPIPHDTALDDDPTGGTALTVDLDIDVAEGGAVIAGATSGSSTASRGTNQAAWVGLVEDFQQGVENNFYSVAHLSNGTQELNRDVACNFTDLSGTTPSAVGVAVSYAGAAVASGDLEASSALSLTYVPDLMAEGRIEAASALVFTSLIDLSAVGVLDSVIGLTFAIQSDLGAEGVLEAGVGLVLDVSGHVESAGQNDISANIPLSITAAANLDAKGRLDALVQTVLTVAPELKGRGELEGEVALAVGLIAELSATGTLNALSQLTLTVVPNAAVGGTLQASPALTLDGIGDLGARGRIQSAIALALDVAASISFPGALAGTADLTIQLDADLSAEGELQGVIDIVLEALGDLVEAGPADFLTIHLVGKTNTIVLTAGHRRLN